MIKWAQQQQASILQTNDSQMHTQIQVSAPLCTLICRSALCLPVQAHKLLSKQFEDIASQSRLCTLAQPSDVEQNPSMTFIPAQCPQALIPQTCPLTRPLEQQLLNPLACPFAATVASKAGLVARNRPHFWSPAATLSSLACSYLTFKLLETKLVCCVKMPACPAAGAS